MEYMLISQEQINLFKSLFLGRQDVYAIRWEKDGKSGYMPAYKVDWSEYQQHKASGGTFKDYQKKEYIPFTDVAIKNHLIGNETVGIYPLLEDNTSFFIAVDFDEADWQETIRKLFAVCSGHEIPSYIERSRSGNGGHLWTFFDENIPAEQTRKLMYELLRESGIISHFDKESSFDRIFPNQDFHSGKGLGNLIALPLNGKTLKSGNAAFLDPNTFNPHENQFDFLKNVQKIDKRKFEELFKNILHQKPHAVIKSNIIVNDQSEIEIQISNQIYLKRLQLNKKLISFLRDNLNFLNSDYLIKKKLGKSTFNIEKYFKLIEETHEEVVIPRGFLNTLISFCEEEKLPVRIIDNRKKLEFIDFVSEIELLPNQRSALETVTDNDYGVIVSPAGSGKTIIGLEIVARKKQPALIIVHRKQLLDQWIERIQNFMNIPKTEIGQIGNQKFKVGKKITVAMIQSLCLSEETDKIKNSFGTIIVDECHHIPAKTFRETVVHFNSFYLYGLTATPKRKNNDENLIYVYIGNILYNAELKDQLKQDKHPAEIHIRETDLYAPFNYKIDKYETISRILIHDTQRNALIIEDIEKHADRFKTILILTERKAHVEILNLYLKDKYEIITIHGDDSDRSRKSKLEQLKHGHFKIVISTGQYFGEGMDYENLDCLFIVYPFAFEGKLVQYIGRIQRSAKPPVIFDYRDSRIDFFEKMFKQRNRFYKKLLK